MKKQEAINKRQLTITKNKALLDLIIPAGISLTAVRGFFASKFLSNQRLKAIAAERAKTMQRMTRISRYQLLIKKSLVFWATERFQGSNTLIKGIFSNAFIPKKNPINANGIAKIVCENFTRER